MSSKIGGKQKILKFCAVITLQVSFFFNLILQNQDLEIVNSALGFGLCKKDDIDQWTLI
jgi:hypothetical protein